MARRALHFLTNVARRSPRGRFALRRHRRRLKFERLEDRRVLTTLTVTTLSDAAVSGPGSAPGTLRQAIYDANISPDADEIVFAANLAGSVQLSIVDDTLLGPSSLVISTPITIRGNANGITIARDSIAGEMRLFRVTPTGNLSFESLSVAEGVARGVAGLSSGEDGGVGQGGAVLNQGAVHVLSSTFHANQAIGGDAGAGGANGFGLGGAIFNDQGVLTVTNSTFSGNSVFSGSTLSVVNAFGGGIYSWNGTVTIHNSTLTSNTAFTGRGLYVLARDGIATVDIQSSILGQSDSQTAIREFLPALDDNGQFVVTGGNNLIRVQGDYHYITTSTDDPLLEPLMNNGGPTRTHALGVGSPAIDAGNNSQSLGGDQRGVGFSRVVGLAADMGAYEVQTAVGPAVAGDYNRDNVVDAADFALWRKTLGTFVANFSGADGNGNGEVDIGDYSVWRDHFGQTPQTGAAAMMSPAENTVPANDVASALIEVASSEEPLGTFAPLFVAETRSAGRPHRAAAVTGIGVSARESDRSLLVLQSPGLRTQYESDALAGKATLRESIAKTHEYRGADPVDAVMRAWPRVNLHNF